MTSDVALEDEISGKEIFTFGTYCSLKSNYILFLAVSYLTTEALDSDPGKQPRPLVNEANVLPAR